MKLSNIHKLLILLASVVILLAGESRQSHAANSEIYSVYLPVVYKNYIKGFTNSGFENGTESWTVQSNQGDSVVTDAAAHTGQRSAGMGNGNSNRLTSITQQVIVPQSGYVLTYYQWVESPELCSNSNNRVMVIVSGHPYQHYRICQDSSNAKWVKMNIYLAPYKGQQVDFKLEFQSSTILNNYLYVDDFSFELP